MRLLTFDANKHELVERQSAVVRHNVGGLHAAQADLAKVFLAGEAGQGDVGKVRVFCHWAGGRKKKEDQGSSYTLNTSNSELMLQQKVLMLFCSPF